MLISAVFYEQLSVHLDISICIVIAGGNHRILETGRTGGYVVNISADYPETNLPRSKDNWPSRPVESHHQPLTEPCMMVSHHTARASHPLESSQSQTYTLRDSSSWLPS